MNEFYVYVYLDPRKPGNYNYSGLTFNYKPFYVGKGKGDRIKAHFYECHNYNQYKWNKIQKIKKLGLEPIILKTIENLTEKEAFIEESITISRIGRSILTNMSDGGEGQSGYKHTEESKRKIGEGVKNSEKWQAIIKSDDHRKKLSDSLMGHIGHVFSHTEETKKRLSQIKKGEQNGFFGKTHSDELKKKWCLERKGINNSNSTLYKIKTPSNDIIELKGRTELKSFLENTNASYSGILRNGKSKGYTIIQKEKIKGLK